MAESAANSSAWMKSSAVAWWMPEQQRLLTKIETLEVEITAAHALLTSALASKEAILKMYL